MPTEPRVLLSGFADEAAVNKTAEEQFVAFAALGLQYYSIRFIDMGGGVKNAMKLSPEELSTVKRLQGDFGLRVSSLGSPIGKIKLRDEEDGTKNAYIPFDRYLAEDVARACELAAFLETNSSADSPSITQGDGPRTVRQRSGRSAGAIADRCAQSGLIFGLEVEPIWWVRMGTSWPRFIVAWRTPTWSSSSTARIWSCKDTRRARSTNNIWR